MPGIPDSIVDDVRVASDLVDVVSDRVRLKKSGRRFVGLCPFHNEKTPSFSVDPEEQLYYCFGCRKGGDVFKFVEDIEGVGFLDAVRLLADRAGIRIPETGVSDAESDRRDTMHAALRFAARFFFKKLAGPTGKKALGYIKDRGFTKETVKTFGLGYAPDKWDAFAREATEEGFDPEILKEVGLVRQREGGKGFYDVFRNRVIFPILSPVGRVLGFGGRVLPGAEEGTAGYSEAKYLNTPESPVYHKSKVLYGLKQAKRAIRAEEEAVLVEGYSDVISLYQAGIQNVVAASGTALAPPQVKLLSQYAQTVLLLFDADEAGQNAATKSINVVSKGGLSPYLVMLPEGTDPDSFVRDAGPDAFRSLIRDKRKDFVTFLVDRAKAAGALDSPEGKSTMTSDIVDALNCMTDPVLREEYIVRAGQQLQLPEAIIRQELHPGNSSRKRGTTTQLAPAERSEEPSTETSMRPQEKELLRLMLKYGAPMIEFVLRRIGFQQFSEGPPRELASTLKAQFEKGSVDRKPFVEGKLGEAIRSVAIEAMAERHSVSGEWEIRTGAPVFGQSLDPYVNAESAIRLLKIDALTDAIDKARREADQVEQRGKDPSGRYRRLEKLQKLRKRLADGEKKGES